MAILNYESLKPLFEKKGVKSAIVHVKDSSTTKFSRSTITVDCFDASGKRVLFYKAVVPKMQRDALIEVGQDVEALAKKGLPIALEAPELN